MLKVLSILFGASFTVTTALALGYLLLHRLRLTLSREEAAPLAFVSGSAVLSLATFFVCLAHQARWFVFLSLGVLAIVWAWKEARSSPPRKSLPALPKVWNALFWLVIGAFFLLYFFNALAPETSPDGSGYHLGNVARLWQRHGFVWDYRSMYSYLSQGMEMLFLVAFSFGRHSAAALVHFAFQFTLPWLIAAYGRRFGFPLVGLFAAAIVYVSPVVGKAGVSAYNDLAVAAAIFAVFYLLELSVESRDANLLVVIGLLAGFAYAIKYTAALALPFAAVVVWWRSGAGARRLRSVTIVMAAAAVMIVPWLARNWIWLGNPLAPFFNQWFPNPFYHPGMEQIYLNELNHYPYISHFWQVPWQLAVRGVSTAGMIGPIFLLAPLALIALYQPVGRRLLLAAIIFAVPAWFNTGSRFLIPVLPFLALSLAFVFAKVRAALPLLLVCEAVACWPHVLSRYSDPASWRLRSIPVAAALRLQPEPQYLKDHLPDYAIKPALETLVPPGAKVFSLNTRAEAYLNRTLVVAYESTLGNLAQDVLAAALDPRSQARVRRKLRFLPITTRAVRVVQTASAENFWSMSEMRFYSRGRELPRAAPWRLSASPNGWEVQLAFDNSYATRWSSWQAMEPGMFVAVDFGGPQTLDEVDLEGPSTPESKEQVDVLSDSGRWVPITDSAEYQAMHPPPGLRRAATHELKAHGVGYLLVNETDFFAEDMRKYPTFWSVTELSATRGIRLYLIQ